MSNEGKEILQVEIVEQKRKKLKVTEITAIIGAVCAVATLCVLLFRFSTGKESLADSAPEKPANAPTASTTSPTISPTATSKPATTTKQQQNYAVGTIVHFGPWDWRVLAAENGKALLLAENILEQRPYNDEFTDVTWETCSLRTYLNDEFLEKFHAKDRARIALTPHYNPDNTWGRTKGKPFNTPGGKPTEDHVFLLSVADVLKYFPGLKLHKDSDGDEWWYEADQRLVARYGEQTAWWWLRSPGYFQYYAAYVDNGGFVSLIGSIVDYVAGGVRPALWLNL